MCLAIPARVVEIEGTRAKVDVGGNLRDADLSVLDDVRVDDYVLVHAGFAIAKVDRDDALGTLDILREMTGEPL